MCDKATIAPEIIIRLIKEMNVEDIMECTWMARIEFHSPHAGRAPRGKWLGIFNPWRHSIERGTEWIYMPMNDYPENMLLGEPTKTAEYIERTRKVTWNQLQIDAFTLIIDDARKKKEICKEAHHRLAAWIIKHANTCDIYNIYTEVMQRDWVVINQMLLTGLDQQ